MFGSFLWLLMFIIFLKNRKKLFLLRIWCICLNSCVFRSSHQTLSWEIDNLWYWHRCSAKTLWKSLALVKLLYVYSSTKDKLFKYFIKKIVWKNTSNFSCLLFAFLNIQRSTCPKSFLITLRTLIYT